MVFADYRQPGRDFYLAARALPSQHRGRRISALHSTSLSPFFTHSRTTIRLGGSRSLYYVPESYGGLCGGGKQPDARDARKGICTVVGGNVSQGAYFKTWVINRDTVTSRSSAIATLPDPSYYSLPSRRREDRYYLCFYYA